MTTEPKGPYEVLEADGKFIVDAPGLLLRSKNRPDAEMWAEAFNLAFKAGRASRDGLREALFEVTGWASDCYCLSEEEASSPGGKTCPGCVAKEALAKDEKEGK